jgi:hypothetical protein
MLLCASAATALSTSSNGCSPKPMSRAPASAPLRLRGGVMWVGGGRKFNRTADPSADYEDGEDTFQPLRDRLERAERIKKLIAKFGPKYRSNELVVLEEEAKYLIRAQHMVRARSLSVDLTAAGNFQRYVVGDLEFSKHRVGIMYGRVEHGNVFCDTIYEPPQDGNAESYKLLPDPDEARVERVASLLGLRKVGIVFTARPRKCIFSSDDVYLSCQQHAQALQDHGFDFARSLVSAIITRNETTGAVVFEAYQVSDQCTDMYGKGVFNKPKNPNKSYSRTSEDVLVERKPTQKVDNDFFINSVPIKTHEAPLFSKREVHLRTHPRPNRASPLGPMSPPACARACAGVWAFRVGACYYYYTICKKNLRARVMSPRASAPCVAPRALARQLLSRARVFCARASHGPAVTPQPFPLPRPPSPLPAPPFPLPLCPLFQAEFNIENRPGVNQNPLEVQLNK